jgi:hypothetical protein
MTQEIMVPVTFSQPAGERKTNNIQPPKNLQVPAHSIAAYKSLGGASYEIFLKEGVLTEFKNWNKTALINGETVKALGLK